MQMIFCYVQFTQGTAVAHDISRLFASFSFRNDIAAREKGEREKEKEEKKQSYGDTFYAMNPFLPSFYSFSEQESWRGKEGVTKLELHMRAA